MKIFVKWDPLHKKVVCVHRTRYGMCHECEDLQKGLQEAGSFLLEDGVELELQEP